MRSFRVWMAAALVTVAAGTAAVRGQAPPQGDDAPRPFKQVFGEWQQLQKSLAEVVRKYRNATAEERPALVAEYQQLMEKAETALDALRAGAVAAYRRAPNRDADVQQALVGIMHREFEQDRYDAAWELAELLLEHEAAEESLPSMAGAIAYCRDDFETARKYLVDASDAGTLTQQGRHFLVGLADSEKAWQREQQLREQEAASDDLPRVELQTSQGTLVIELYENEAPQTVANFIHLVESKYYDGLTFHRVLPGFMAQGGCPEGSGRGGPGYTIYCECHQPDHRKHFRGTLSMAHAGRDTGGSQFFLTFRRTSHLDGKHTVFGRVVQGLPVLAELQRRNPGDSGGPPADRIIKARVLRKRDHAYEPTKVR